jgi:hypothetical protein
MLTIYLNMIEKAVMAFAEKSNWLLTEYQLNRRIVLFAPNPFHIYLTIESNPFLQFDHNTVVKSNQSVWLSIKLIVFYIPKFGCKTKEVSLDNASILTPLFSICTLWSFCIDKCCMINRYLVKYIPKFDVFFRIRQSFHVPFS